jgi:ABC-2 type transport system ATP-binding protein
MLEQGRDIISGAPEALVARYWPNPRVIVDAEDRSSLDALATMNGVVAFERNGAAAAVELDDLKRVPDLVARLAAEGVRLTRVVPHEPTLEDLYFAVRNRGVQ